MRKITKKTTTEEFKGGELIKRTIEETTEEINDTKRLEPITLPKVGDQSPPWDKLPRTWCTTTSENNIALLKSCD